MKDFSTVSVFISVVSHGHGDLIEKLSCLSNLAKEYHVVVKLNTEEQSFVSYLENHKIMALALGIIIILFIHTVVVNSI
jgi:hypothetical protein